MSVQPDDLLALPGGDLVARGLEDLRKGAVTIESLLVEVGRTKLGGLGLDVPPSATAGFPEDALYALLAAAHGNAAHSRYNALIRRLVSFERALACASRRRAS